jgi:hypothetical protein
MDSKVPLPTDNVFKFYALFGLVIIIFGLYSILYVNKSANELISKSLLSVEAIEMIEKPSDYQKAELAILKKKKEVAIADRDIFIKFLGGLIGVGLMLAIYGFHRWHTIIQPMQDNLVKLTIEKLKLEIQSEKNIIDSKNSQAAKLRQTETGEVDRGGK